MAGVDHVAVFLVHIRLEERGQAWVLVLRGVGGVEQLGERRILEQGELRIVGAALVVLPEIDVGAPIARLVVIVLDIGRPAVGGAIVHLEFIEPVLAADGEHRVPVGLLQQDQVRLRLEPVDHVAGLVRRGRIAVELGVEVVLVGPLLIPGHVQADIVAVVVIRLEGELPAIAEAPAIVVVAAEVHAVVAAVAVVAGLDIVHPAPVVLARGGDHQGERGRVGDPAGAVRRDIAQALDRQLAMGEAETGAGGEAGCERARMVMKVLIAPAQFALEERMGEVLRGPRRQFDLAAQALGLAIRRERLVDDDPVDRARGDGVELHRAPAAAGRRARREGVQQHDPAIGGAIEVGVDAADIDEAALARVGGERHARDTAQGLGGVVVRIFGDGLGRLDRHDHRRGLLLDPRELLLPGRRDGDAFHIVWSRRILRGLGRASQGKHRGGAQ